MTSQIGVPLFVFYLSHELVGVCEIKYLTWVKTTEIQIWCVKKPAFVVCEQQRHRADWVSVLRGGPVCSAPDINPKVKTVELNKPHYR